jgi:dolichol-phosphate hexosyltransferase
LSAAEPQGGLSELSVTDVSDSADPARMHRLRGALQLYPQLEALPTAGTFKLSILMPAYNEEATIVRAVAEILTTDYPCAIELIVVDDGSTDRTGVLLSQLNDERLIVHRHEANQGKGAALCSAASLASGTHILPFDADLEYAAEDIPRLVEPILTGRCSIVYGARLFGCNTVYQTYRYALGNRLLTGLANILFNAYLSDLHTCLKMMPLPVLRELNLREKGFGLDTEMTALLLRKGIRPFEIPVSYYSRSHAQGKKITWRDAVICAWILCRVRLNGRSGSKTAKKMSAGPQRHDQPATQPSHRTALQFGAYLGTTGPADGPNGPGSSSAALSVQTIDGQG